MELIFCGSFYQARDWSRAGNAQATQSLQIQRTRGGQRSFRRGLQQKRELQQGWLRPAQQRKDLLQQLVAVRSSAFRQEKLKEARARMGASMHAASKMAGWQTLQGNMVAPMSRFSRKAAQESTRLVGTASRQMKTLAALRNTKTVVNHQMNMVGAARRVTPTTKVVSVTKGPFIHLQRQNWRANKMSNGSGRKPQTLDSRFASLREERQLNSQLSIHTGWRR
ncbi:hypothetical protein KP509_22G063800 [Ceratopteris richardii]|uniref:Uncharacterized protein n=1 Tax=Ceratopteris richardii TaxID=49495 RepID=A0A8T2S7T7_CERRI|nr:hypothetical protein KP509_22G063800 [Ceratopteris richardii]